MPVAVLAGVLSVWALGGFPHAAPARPTPAATPGATGPVAMPGTKLPRAATDACQKLIKKLPDSVRAAARRPVTGATTQSAAYGDPPVRLSCGVSAPAVAPTDEVFPISGVCWVVHSGSNGADWITVDRVVPVRVTVPGSPEGSAQWPAAFAPLIGTTIEVTTTAPRGCTP